ncbi:MULTISPECIES: hypothetical protein [Paraburkholderia]|uniref:hypothetical protein n=1 Tax=Paraburkholderia TaxID=1822464 RepID=UPI0038BA7847
MGTVYKEQCAAWGNAIRQKADEFYNHQIEETKNLIKDSIGKGLNPKAIELEGGIATVDYEILLQRTINAKNSAYADSESREATCNAAAPPEWVGDTQKITDFAMTVALLPYVALTHDYAAQKIDLGEVYKGHTFGGDNALFPKARADVLSALGIGGDTAKFLSDPVNTAQQVVTDVIGAIGKALPDLPVPNFPEIKIDLPKF